LGILHILWMIIVGFIVGALARWLYPGAVTLGFWATALVGIIGSLVGGVIAGYSGARRTANFIPPDGSSRWSARCSCYGSI